MAYKKDQGRMARMTAYWSGTIFLFYGCVSLFRELTGRSEQLSQAVGGIEIPVLGMDLSPSLMIATVHKLPNAHSPPPSSPSTATITAQQPTHTPLAPLLQPRTGHVAFNQLLLNIF